jgi:3D (Asp-Asp-Asp) domain-containing protein
MNRGREVDFTFLDYSYDTSRSIGILDSLENSPCHPQRRLYSADMKKIAIICLAGMVASGCEGLGDRVGKGAKVPFVATAYSSGAKCNGPWAHKNAIGGSLKSGALNSAASDWSRLPVDTKFRVSETGKIYIVDDYGSAMVGRDKVDLYKTNYSDVYRWGVRNVTLEILQMGCYRKSLEILKPRSKWWHVKRMVDDLKKREET